MEIGVESDVRVRDRFIIYDSLMLKLELPENLIQDLLVEMG
jgi:hypothetical protein